jgi:hypothetical protein
MLKKPVILISVCNENIEHHIHNGNITLDSGRPYEDGGRLE